MTHLDQQLHGYRHGHQLLSATVKLSKLDQDLVDRLSDIAGPLRPSEQFEPFLTCYPLPSETQYVVARTWQDFSAPRAGCVLTRSFIVPMSMWVAGVDLVRLIDQLGRQGPSGPAERVQIGKPMYPLPYVEASQAMELVEALFLEDRKPIVVFDAPDPEGITLRLLTALWASRRRTFAVSTFSLSPRTIGGRSFDLIFAPRDARPRFTDWEGRRIDARTSASERHRWSKEILDRVFGDDQPSLSRHDALGELSSETGATEVDLRISLLWNELLRKLETSPNAVLGLLDIANSRPSRNIDAIKRLEPELARAAHRATTFLPPAEAWRFLLALTEKLRDVRLQLSVAKAIRRAAVKLATLAPAEAIAKVGMLASGLAHELLLGAVGDGVAQGFDAERAAAVADLDPGNLLELLLTSPALADVSLPHYSELSKPLATALLEAPQVARDNAKRYLLRLLVDDHLADAARILIAELTRDELFAEIILLAKANGLKAESLHEPLVKRARKIEAVTAMRDLVARVPASFATDSLLLRLLTPTEDDLQWLLTVSTLTDERRLTLARRLLSSAAREQFKSMITGSLFEPTLHLLMQNPRENFDIADRMLEEEHSAPGAVDAALRLLPYADSNRATHLASRALRTILPQVTGRNRDAALDGLLATMGSNLDGSRAIWLGLAPGVTGDVFAANLAAFNRSAPAVRQRILLAVEDMVSAIVARGRVDYPESAVADAAQLLWDSSFLNEQAFLRASSLLMPFLLRAQREPVSALIAAAFPPVYQELKKAEDAPDFLRLFRFVDWDKCKAARRDLVEAFMSSTWRATDIALAAARAGDVERILRRIAKQDDGRRVIDEIQRDLLAIDDPWRSEVREALSMLHGYPL